MSDLRSICYLVPRLAARKPLLKKKVSFIDPLKKSGTKLLTWCYNKIEYLKLGNLENNYTDYVQSKSLILLENQNNNRTNAFSKEIFGVTFPIIFRLFRLFPLRNFEKMHKNLIAVMIAWETSFLKL